MSLDRNVAVVEARAGLTDRVLNLTQIVNNSNGVWERGLDNDGLTPSEEVQFLGLYNGVRSQMLTQWARWSRIGPVDPYFAPRSFAFALYTHPGLQRIHEIEMTFRQSRESAFVENNSIVRGEFDALVDIYLQELDQSKPEPNRHYIYW